MSEKDVIDRSAAPLTAASLTEQLRDRSPLGKLYELDGHVLR